MSTLTNAQQHIESLVQDLRGEADFMPFLITRRGGQEFYFGLAAMADETKNDIADLMGAAVTVTQPDEAVFASVTWMVQAPKGTNPEFRPSEHPDRKEVVMVLHVTRDGSCMYSAALHRRDNRVLLGAWDRLGAEATGGRFADAIHAGMKVGAAIPEDFQQWCQERIAAGKFDEVLRPAMNAFRKVRTGVEQFEQN